MGDREGVGELRALRGEGVEVGRAGAAVDRRVLLVLEHHEDDVVERRHGRYSLRTGRPSTVATTDAATEHRRHHHPQRASETMSPSRTVTTLTAPEPSPIVGVTAQDHQSRQMCER